MLSESRLVAFVPTSDAARAQNFYEHVLGLRLVSDDQFALVFESGGISIRVVRVDAFTPQPFTVLGWQVRDIRSTARELMQRGVVFERIPSLKQDDLGIWTSPGGAGVAWFKDPDGNTLSISSL